MLKSSSIQLYKLIPLAGPDRLLRVAFGLQFESYHNEDKLTEQYDALSYIINACLFKEHGLTSKISKEEFFSWLCTEDNKSYDGRIIIELLIRKNKPAEIHVNYYSKELELARKFFEIEYFYKINKEFDPETYPRPVSLINLREGDKQKKSTISIKVQKV